MLKEQGVEQLVLTSRTGIAAASDGYIYPLSEAAQRAAPVLLALRDVLGLKVRLCWRRTRSSRKCHSAEILPLHAINARVSTDRPERAPPRRPSSRASLPKHQVLTLRVDTPEAWDAQMASKASSDLDNIRDGDARIAYELKSPGGDGPVL